MTVMTQRASSATGRAELAAPAPRFGGMLWRIVRVTTPLMLPLAGRRWNPTFAIIEHIGRTSGRQYATPVAGRRIAGGFVIALAFGAQVDWHRNLIAADGAVIRWRSRAYRVTAPERIDAATALPAFNLIQRLALRLARVDGYVRVADLGDQPA